MAKFDEAPNPTNDPSYLGMSKEPDRMRSFPLDSSTPNRPANNSLGTLFSGIAELGGLAIKAADGITKENIVKDAYALIDPVRNAHGADITPEEVPAISGKGVRGSKYTAADGGISESEDIEPLPKGAVTSLAGLKRLSAARDAGALSDSHYNASLQSVVQELRSRYPGYRAEIDSTVSSITGIVPANALRKSLLADMNARASAAGSADAKDQAWYEKNKELIHSLYPGIDKRAAISNRAAVEIGVGDLSAEKFNLEQENLKIRNMDAQDANRAVRTTRLVTDEANLTTSVYVKGALNTLGPQLRRLQDAGANASPEEVQALTVKFAQAEAQISQAVDAALRTPTGNGAETRLSIIVAKGGMAKVNEIKESVLAPVRQLHEMVRNKEYGAAFAAANILANQKSMDQLRLRDNIPEVRTLQALATGLDPAVMNHVLQQTNALPHLTAAIANRGLAQILDRTSSTQPPQVSQIIDNQKEGNPAVVVPAQVVRTTIDAVHKLAEHKDPKVASRAVESLFTDPDFFARIPIKQKMAVAEKLMAPDFTKKMEKLRESEPKAWDRYKAWSDLAFETLFSPSINNIKDWPGAPSSDYNWSWNAEQGKIEIALKAGIPPGSREAAVANDRSAGLRRELETINRGLRLLKPIYEADSQNPGEQLLVKLTELGLNPNAPDRQRDFQFIKQIWDSITKSVPQTPAGDSKDNPVKKRP